MCRRMLAERGQAGVEWLAVVCVVAGALLAAASGALPGADALPRAVGAGFARAFCLVSGGDCLGKDGPRPCVVGSHERSQERRLAVLLGRLADGRRVLREERSDGTVVVTVEDVVRAGGGPSVSGAITLGGRGVDFEAAVRGDLRGGAWRRYVLADAAAADALIERLEDESTGAAALAGRVVRGGDGDEPAPDERWWTAGYGGEAEAGAALKGLGLGADAKLVSDVVAGVRTRSRTGERTLLLRTDGEVVAALTGPLAARLGLALPSSAAVELALDAGGRPVTLTVRGARGVHGEAAVRARRSGGGDLVEVEARLHLADPVVRSEVARLVAAIGDVAPRRAVASARALGGRLVSGARVDVRRYETDRSASSRDVNLGAARYEEEEIVRTARLVDAAGREPGQGWMRRLDCVGVA